MYEKYQHLKKMKGVSDYAVSKDTGIPRSTISTWKKESTTISPENVRKLSEYFSVPIDYFYGNNGEEKYSHVDKTYYIDEETAKIAQKLFENKDLHALMDSVSTLSADKVKALATMAKMLKGTNPDG